ncbi:MAG: hypothetical protein FWF24_02710 [Alphaproteobacteria bacterium]|nr:hypothetical protein [Alphaproteobacteria bacterium]
MLYARDPEDEGWQFDICAVQRLFPNESFSSDQWDEFINELQDAKAAWCRDKKKKSFSPSEAQKASKHIAKARMSLSNLYTSEDFQFEHKLSYQKISSDPYHAYFEDMARLELLEKFLAKLGEEKLKRGPNRTPIGMFIYQLCEAYVSLTGKDVTHNPYDETNHYVSKSVSPAGKIITKLAKILVSDDIRDTQVATVLRFYVQEKGQTPTRKD